MSIKWRRFEGFIDVRGDSIVYFVLREGSRDEVKSRLRGDYSKAPQSSEEALNILCRRRGWLRGSFTFTNLIPIPIPNKTEYLRNSIDLKSMVSELKWGPVRRLFR